jgi:hypothetical protein
MKSPLGAIEGSTQAQAQETKTAPHPVLAASSPRPASASGSLVPMSQAAIAGIGGAIGCQVILLSIAGWHNRHVIVIADAVSYIRIASYYLNGQFGLAVSGYWGPLFSWLMAPWLALVHSPLDAARIAMGVSAVVFLLGSVSILRGLQLPPAGLMLGTWITAMASVSWSVEHITPDLLLSGLMALAISHMMRPQWPQSRPMQFTAGMLWGTAYLAKSVAFVLAFGVGGSLAGLWMISRRSRPKIVLHSLGMTLLGFLLVAAPWVMTLSWKYQGFTFSTNAKINHAIAGPHGKPGAHPQGFYIPEPGRIWWWEDPPPNLYQDLYWSPLESLAYAKHQVKVMYKNAKIVVNTLSGFDALHVGLVTAVFGLLVHLPWRANMAAERWRWAGVPIVGIAGIYLPVYATSQRYYVPTYAFLIAASLGMAAWLTRHPYNRTKWPRLIGFSLITLSFAYPLVGTLPRALKGLEDPAATYAYDLAKRLQAAGLYGAIAGTGCYRNPWEGEPVEPYVALFTNQRYYDCEPNPTAERLKGSRAKLVIVDRRLPLTATLEQDPAFKNLDHVLFTSKEEADTYPLKVYQLELVEGNQLG